MDHPERLPPPGIQNTFTWSTSTPPPVAPGWNYIARFPPPVGFSPGWAGNTLPPNIGTVPQANSWPYPPLPVNSTPLPVLPPNLPFCPPPPLDAARYPPPPLPSAGGLQFGVPPPALPATPGPRFPVPPPVLPVPTTLPGVVASVGFPVLDSNSLTSGPVMQPPGIGVVNNSITSPPAPAAEPAVQDSQTKKLSKDEVSVSSASTSNHKKSDKSKCVKSEVTKTKDPRIQTKEYSSNSLREPEKNRMSEKQRFRKGTERDREKGSRDSDHSRTRDRHTRRKEADERSSYKHSRYRSRSPRSSRSPSRRKEANKRRSYKHSLHRSRSPRSPSRRRHPRERKYGSERQMRKGSPNRHRYSDNRDRRSRTDKSSRFSDSRNRTSSSSRSRSPSLNKEKDEDQEDVSGLCCPKASEDLSENVQSQANATNEGACSVSDSQEDFIGIVSSNSDHESSDENQSQKTKEQSLTPRKQSKSSLSLNKSNPKKISNPNSEDEDWMDISDDDDQSPSSKTKSPKRRKSSVTYIDSKKCRNEDTQLCSIPSKNSYFETQRNRSRELQRQKSRERTEENQPALSTEASKWITSSPAEDFYRKVEENSKEVVGTDTLKELHERFRQELLLRAERARAIKPKYNPPVRKTKLRKHKPPEAHSGSDSSSSSKESSSEEEDTALEELEKKRQHPDRLHPELWFNDPREMNDGPLCRCSAKARRSGIRHGIYVGESHLSPCDPWSNNAKRLHHYKITMTPVTNFLTQSPTIIIHKGEKYIFEGFSMLAHKPLPKLPNCKVIRFNYEYTILYIEEDMPPNFTVAGLELFNKFLMEEVLELADLDWKAYNDPDGCPKFHFMPRFAKVTKDNGKKMLSLNVVLEYLLNENQMLIKKENLPELYAMSNQKWQGMADEVKGMIVTCPSMKPSSIRVDQLDREHLDSKLDTDFPVIVHFGVRPPQLSYAGNPHYQKAWRDYVKYRHLLANKPKVRYADRHKLMRKESKLQEMRMENDLKRDVTVVISSKGFFKTGMMSDIVQHAMLLPILVCHLRFHDSLSNLEDKIGYKFADRFLLQLALTHPSYRENFGTNPDHARNSLTNCGLRQPQYGDRRIHYMNTRKRGINTLINIMSRFGSQQEATSSINHNERLEFLGDAVVEFLSSIHLFYLFPDLEEGGLATYRAAIVQNQHLAVLSKKLQLEKFMLYAHGSDLCHDLELRHAMANCFEALMGALFLDGGIEAADKVFSKTLFPEQELLEVWKNYPLHPLQEQEPNGDRQWIASVPLLQKLNKFEEQIGIEFTHIRLLARALTHRSLGYNNLTLGSNQRLEFLGDTVLQLVASEYLYKFFPQHHEGHLSLLRSSLVNNRTQAVVCGDLGMIDYAIYPYFKVELKPKDKADLLEAFLGALYVDKDLGYCRKFCEVCFFPRLQHFIMNQDWNDPKSKLQQCCLTLRSMDGGEPDIPTYKVIECKGPTNTRVYAVAVYFQGNRLAVGSGHSIQQAEMDAANNALMKSQDLFPQLKHQKRAIERSLKQGTPRIPNKYAKPKKN